MSVDVDRSPDGRVETWWLSRVDARNAITLAMWGQLREAAESVAARPQVRAVVIRGRGDHFSAGADIVGLGRHLAADTPGTNYRAANAAAERAVSTLPVPVVAAIDGFCVGGGVQLALACDLRVATRRARFAVTPAKLGIVYPVAAITRLVAMVGTSRASELLLTGETISAEQAWRDGLVTRLTDDLDAAVTDLVDVLLARSPLTQAATKDVLNALVARGDLDARGREWEQRSLAHGDLDEGLAAFVDKRAPRFHDRPT